MVNPLVLKFCLWLLTTELFSYQRIIYDKLVAYAAQRIDIPMFDIDIVDKVYPAMGIREALRDGNSLKLEFFKHIFQKLEHVRVFQIRYDETSGHYFRHQTFDTDILAALGLISHSILSKMSLLSVTEGSLLNAQPDLNSDALPVSIELPRYVSYELFSKINVWLTTYGVLKRTPQMFAKIYSKNSLDSQNLCPKAHEGVAFIRV